MRVLSLLAYLFFTLKENESTYSIGTQISRYKEMQSTPVFLPRNSHGQRSLAGYSPRRSQRVGRDLATKQQKHNICHIYVFLV